MNRLQALLTPLARTLLVGVFLAAAARHALSWSSSVAFVADHGLPEPKIALALGILLQVLGGLSVTFGCRARLGAALLLLFLAVATPVFHPVWTETAHAVPFLQNLALAGGLLLVAVHGSGPGSIDHHPALAARLRGWLAMPGALFAVALLVRMLVMAVLDSPSWADDREPWDWGRGAACLAKALCDGRGYADVLLRPEAPWNLPTGPSAQHVPGYPLLMAGLFAACGGLNPLSAGLLVVLQNVASAWTCALLPRLGERLGAPRAGWLAGWLLVVHPESLWAAVHVWDATFTALGMVLLLLGLFRAAPAGRWRCALLGAGFGAILLFNATPAAAAPRGVLWLARGRDSAKERLVAPALFALGALVVCLPWLARNQAVFGAPLMRSCIGQELMVGNNDDANGRSQYHLHPSASASHFEKLRTMGERDYDAWAAGQAWAWIDAHRGRFAELCGKRAGIFWFGEYPEDDPRQKGGRPASADPRNWLKWSLSLLTGALGLLGAAGLALRSAAWRYVLALMVLFPAAYYATHVLDRYRFPLEPLILLGGAWLVQAGWSRWRRR